MISGASRGAFRRGRYATRSIATAVPTDAMIAPMIMIGRIHTLVLPSKNNRYVVSAPNAPIMKTSPWAKLISCTMP